MSKNLDLRIDAYIGKSAAFAQPILTQLRAWVHAGCPAATETIKWGMPHFEHAGGILCHMAAFKAHCVFGFWHKGMARVIGARGKADAMGSFGRITTVADLPDAATMQRWVREAAALNESGGPGRPRAAVRKARPEPATPAFLEAALKKNRAAAQTFAAFPPSHRREYIEWLVEAKRDETRQRRLAITLEQLAAGRSRNWKYQDC